LRAWCSQAFGTLTKVKLGVRRITKILSRFDFNNYTIEQLNRLIDDLYVASNSLPRLEKKSAESEHPLEKFERDLIRTRWEKAVLAKGLIQALTDLNLAPGESTVQISRALGSGLYRLASWGINISTLMTMFAPSHIPRELDRLNSREVKHELDRLMLMLNSKNFDFAFQKFNNFVGESAQWSVNYNRAKTIHMRMMSILIVGIISWNALPVQQGVLFAMGGKERIIEILVELDLSEYESDYNETPSKAFVRMIREEYDRLESIDIIFELHNRQEIHERNYQEEG
jgi:hypothetical protein